MLSRLRSVELEVAFCVDDADAAAMTDGGLLLEWDAVAAGPADRDVEVVGVAQMFGGNWSVG